MNDKAIYTNIPIIGKVFMEKFIVIFHERISNVIVILLKISFKVKLMRSVFIFHEILNPIQFLILVVIDTAS